MGPLGLPLSKSQPRPEGKEGEECSLPNHPYLTTGKTNNPKPQREEDAKCLDGEAFHKRDAGSGLFMALNLRVPAESPVKPLVLKLVRCLVLINELQIPHPCALSLVTGKNENPCELEREAGPWVSSPLLRGHYELVSHLPRPLAPHLALAFGKGTSTSRGTIGKWGGQPRQRAAGKTPSLARRPVCWHLRECVIAFTQVGGGGKVRNEEAEVGWAQGP